MELKNIKIRSAVIADLSEMQILFRENVLSISSDNYTEDQKQAWASAAYNADIWISKLKKQFFVIAELDGNIAGFASLERNDYFDMFYVHKDMQGQGIGAVLYELIIVEAKRLGSVSIYSDVSITARPFFERRGFRVLSKQSKIVNGVELINFKMFKELTG